MDDWEEELDLDVSDIWAAAGEQPVAAAQEDSDDLVFDSETRTRRESQLGLKGQEGGACAQERELQDAVEGEETPWQEPEEDDLERTQRKILHSAPESHGLSRQSETHLPKGATTASVLRDRQKDAPDGDEQTQLDSLNRVPLFHSLPLPSRTYKARDAAPSFLLAKDPSVRQANVPHDDELTELETFKTDHGVPLPSRTRNAREDGNPSLLRSQHHSGRQATERQYPRERVSISRETSQSPDIRLFFQRKEGAVEERGAKRARKIPGPAGAIQQENSEESGSSGPKHVGGHGAPLLKRGICCDEEFTKGPWLSALRNLNVEEFDPARYAILKATASSIKGSSSQSQVSHLVAVIKELTLNIYGDATVLLKDPTGTLQGCINRKVLSDSEYSKDMVPGAVILLQKVAIFSPNLQFSSAQYLNITVNNVVQVFAVDTSPPQGKGTNPTEVHMRSETPPEAQPTRALSEETVSRHQQTEGALNDEGRAAAAKRVGWDLTIDMETLLNDDGGDFYA